MTIRRAEAEVSPESFGATPDGRSDSAAAIEAALRRGPVRLTPGATYRIRRPVDLRSGETLRGDRTARIVAAMADFPSTDKFGPAGPALLRVVSADDVLIEGFQLEFEAGFESWAVGIGAGAARRCVFRDLEIFGFNRGYLFSLDSCFDCEVADCLLRDCRIDASTQGQLTGISIDENRPRGVNSDGVLIRRNRIARLTVTPAFALAFSYQTDGVNICGTSPDDTGTRAIVTRNVISQVGEGIDSFGKDGVISDNVLIDCVMAGVKLIHGASRNRVVGNRIDGAGFRGIAIEGSARGLTATADNLIEGNVITRVGETPGALYGAAAAIMFMASRDRPGVLRTTIRGNRIFNIPRAAFAARAGGRGPPFDIVYDSNSYDGSARTREIDRPTAFDFRAPGPTAAAHEVSTRAIVEFLDLERRLAASAARSAAR